MASIARLLALAIVKQYSVLIIVIDIFNLTAFYIQALTINYRINITEYQISTFRYLDIVEQIIRR